MRDATTFYRIGENTFALGTFVGTEEVATMSNTLQIICHKSLGKDSGFCRRQRVLSKIYLEKKEQRVVSRNPIKSIEMRIIFMRLHYPQYHE